MAGPAFASRRARYSGTAFARLRLAAAASLALAVGGCSMSYQLDSPFGKGSKDEAQPHAVADATGSIRPGSSGGVSTAGLPPETDLAYTRAAVVEVLARGGKDSSAAWENPQSGARGTVTPIASAYTLDGAVCHDFLASYVRQGAESWMQGEACRPPKKGPWEVKSLRPWKRS